MSRLGEPDIHDDLCDRLVVGLASLCDRSIVLPHAIFVELNTGISFCRGAILVKPYCCGNDFIFVVLKLQEYEPNFSRKNRQFLPLIL